MDPSELPPEVREAINPDQPPILLTFERVFCMRHGELFRKDWPVGSVVFQVAAWEKIVAGDKLGDMPEGLTSRQQAGWIELQLSERPLCCRLDDLGHEETLRAYLKAKKWKRRLCRRCGELREGAPFKVLSQGGEGPVVELSHVCLWCVVWHLRSKGEG